MNTSAYDPEGELPPPPPSYLNAPPPTSPPAAYAAAPPPPPPAGADFSQPFDPSAFPPPGGYQPAGRETYQAPDAPQAAPDFSAASAYDSSFDPAAFAAPSYEASSYDTAFDPTAFAAPSPASAFDASAFEPSSHDGVPIFDTGAFDTPPSFDSPAAEPVEPPAFVAPVAAAPSVAEPVEAPAPPAAAAPSVAEPVEAPAAVSARSVAEPVEAPAPTTPAAPPADAAPIPIPEPFEPAAFAPPAPSTAVPAFDAPVAAHAAHAAPSVADAPVAVPPPVAAHAATPTPAFEDLLAAPAPTAAPAGGPTYAPPAFTAPVPPVPAQSEVAALAAAAAELGGRRAERERVQVSTPAPSASAPSAPKAEASAPPLEVGLGQEGSDPDLVAALNSVVQLRASDLHIGVNAAPMIRVDGGLRPIPGLEAWDADKVMTALHSIMSPEHRDQFANELELDFAYTLSETSRFRVNIYQQRNVLGAAFRLIPTEIKQLAALGIPERIGKFAQLPRGLVLVTGPTGSGKSTTLAALIDLVNATRSDHIVTVEDPIEFMHNNKKSIVNQREVGHDTHSFNNALKHVLRQDPDVILIGELRDLETISVALTAAETGHLVFATLHTQDAPQTIDRVIDVFPPHQQDQVRAQLAATLQGVVCQTLIKKAHGEGRAVATEVLITTPAVANLIREGKTYQIHSAMQAGREMGMHTMDQHLADLVNARQITHQAAYEKAHDLEDLKQLISRSGSEGASHDFSAQSSEIDFDDSFSRKGA